MAELLFWLGEWYPFYRRMKKTSYSPKKITNDRKDELRSGDMV